MYAVKKVGPLSLCLLVIGCVMEPCVDRCFEGNDYDYENTHKIEDFLNVHDSCVVFDETQFQTGFKELNENPFYSNDPFEKNLGYGRSDIKMTKREYDKEINNYKCTNPIKVRREINIYSISIPDVCEKASYAGSVYTGSTSYIGYGRVNTFNNSFPVYNKELVPCRKTAFLTEIKFYKDKIYLGHISDKYWNYNNLYHDKIFTYTYQFRDILELERKRENMLSK